MPSFFPIPHFLCLLHKCGKGLGPRLADADDDDDYNDDVDDVDDDDYNDDVDDVDDDDDNDVDDDDDDEDADFS